MKSILGSVRKLIGGIETDGGEGPFDNDLILHINSVFNIINQLGVGPKKPFSITDETETWDDFWGDSEVINLVESYMYLKVRLLFDPPSTGALHEAMENQIKEFEWRLQVAGDTTPIEEVEEDDDDE